MTERFVVTIATLSTLEERIIIYADRRVDIITDGIVSFRDEREAEERFEEILRTIPKYGKTTNPGSVSWLSSGDQPFCR